MNFLNPFSALHKIQVHPDFGPLQGLPIDFFIWLSSKKSFLVSGVGSVTTFILNDKRDEIGAQEPFSIFLISGAMPDSSQETFYESSLLIDFVSTYHSILLCGILKWIVRRFIIIILPIISSTIKRSMP